MTQDPQEPPPPLSFIIGDSLRVNINRVKGVSQIGQDHGSEGVFPMIVQSM